MNQLTSVKNFEFFFMLLPSPVDLSFVVVQVTFIDRIWLKPYNISSKLQQWSRFGHNISPIKGAS